MKFVTYRGARNIRVKAIRLLGLIAALTGCIPEQQAVIGIKDVSDGNTALARLEQVFLKLEYKVETVYSGFEQRATRVAVEQDGDLVMRYRSNAYDKAQIVARFRATRNQMEIKFLESPVTTKDWRFSARATEQHNKLVDAVKAEFGPDRVTIERAASS